MRAGQARKGRQSELATSLAGGGEERDGPWREAKTRQSRQICLET